MSVPLFTVTKSVHNMPSIQLMGGNRKYHRFLRWAVQVNHIDHPAYKLGCMSGAGAFLQSVDDDPPYTLVEFWQSNYQPFVDWLNENAEETIAYYIMIGAWENQEKG